MSKQSEKWYRQKQAYELANMQTLQEIARLPMPTHCQTFIARQIRKQREMLRMFGLEKKNG